MLAPWPRRRKVTLGGKKVRSRKARSWASSRRFPDLLHVIDFHWMGRIPPHALDGLPAARRGWRAKPIRHRLRYLSPGGGPPREYT